MQPAATATGKLWEPAGKLVHTQTQWSMGAQNIRQENNRRTNRPTNTWNRWERGGFPTVHTHIYFAHDHTHTLLAGFSVLLAAGSGCSCLPFLDGVLLILGEWNLSISFMVKEDRWDRCESMARGKTEKVEWSVEEDGFSGGE